MINKTTLFGILFFVSITVTAQIITVKQNGTGDYTTIQAAINASADGDTVLVWPGTYYENVDFAGKNITLASRMLTTGDPTYKYNTIIDGNHSGSCIIVRNEESNTVVYGFTLQHGIGYEEYPPEPADGGAIYINSGSTCTVVNSIIKNNNVTGSGGGIVCKFFSTLNLEGSTISQNHSFLSGGGIAIGYESVITLDTINLCSIYLNFSGWGCELNKPSGELYIKLDTSTVLHPDSYFFSSIDDNGYQVDDIIFNIQHQKITPVDSDLFVNPITGNDSNSGINPNEALKTIAFAYSKIVVDSTQKNTIHLANGIYSDTINGEKFPLNIRPFINVAGESRDETILDGEYKSKLLKGNNDVSNYKFYKMTLRRGTYVNYADHFSDKFGLALLYHQKNNIFFDSIRFSEGHSRGGYGSVLSNSSEGTVHFNACIFSNNIGDAALQIGLNPPYDTCLINNCIFNSNKPDTNDPDLYYQIGRGLGITGNGIGIISNSLFLKNDWQAMISSYYSNTDFVNCTFVQNSFLNEDEVVTINNSSLSMFNSIIYDNNTENTFILYNTEHNSNTQLTINHSLIEGGAPSIGFNTTCNNDCFLYYDSTNINTDPLFYGGDEFPYNLSAESPCIDAGTLDLPDFINLPATDLAGNPRIFNGKIDMGAYEWNPTVDVKEIKNQESKIPNLKVYPNPFGTETTISARWNKRANVTIEIYNNAGLLIKTLQSGNQLPGSCKIPWNSTDNNGNIVPAGVYFVVLTINANERESIKVVKK